MLGNEYFIELIPSTVILTGTTALYPNKSLYLLMNPRNLIFVEQLANRLRLILHVPFTNQLVSKCFLGQVLFCKF